MTTLTGGVFLADDAPWNLVRQLQSNEYVRYQRRLSRRRGRALVLTGTGTVFKISVLRAVQQARRDGRLPDLGEAGGVYDISALTQTTLDVFECNLTLFASRPWRFRTGYRYEDGGGGIEDNHIFQCQLIREF